MNNREAYNKWADNYDIVENKTRDIEAVALKKKLSGLNFSNVLEIGCGTGKNTRWIASVAKQVVAVDFSSEMIAKAKAKNIDNVKYVQADITQKWNFTNEKFDLITCSLILEHIHNIDFVFEQVNASLKPGGFFYIGELHPFKQYQGSKARFETGNGTFELDCYIHNISDYFVAAKNHNLDCIDISEWFDDDVKSTVPRLLSIIFKNGNKS